ncbi:MAG: ABC transporter ATP-binding protein [Christensenellales bacterium]|mgnify:CR=1 FL=1|uniref:ABC transporter ATP-binding protein n=1 Tax=Candidatus Avichristensenella intestinipullorum TaxID=2840693 RepID=A0A9D1CJG4_9FIRM|nr:ABC transporter ATP-binding protein [Christensenellales bacterium]HIQ62614.1 ABC transporter ATP-binding protein [Candidatus Avichristensenella intestinipullorum]
MQYLEEKDYSEHFDASLWRRLLRHAKPFHRHLVCTAALMGVSALIDAVFPLMTRYAIDHFITGATTEGLAAFIAVYVGLVAAQVAAIYFFLRIAGRIEVGVCYLIRKEGFERLQELPFAYYDRTPVGYIMARMTSDAQRLSDTIGWSLLDLCWGAFYLVFTAIAMFSLHWKLALCVMLVLPPLAAVSWYFQKRLLKSYRQVRKTNSQITGAFNEGIMGAKTTKTLVREEANYQEFTVLTQRMYTSSVRAATLSAIYLPIVISLGMLATAYAVWKGGYDVFTGLVTLGTLQVFVNYTVSFFEPVQQIARIFADLQSSQAAAERVMTLIEAEPELKDSPEVVRRYGDSFAPKRENWPALEGSVEFDHVSFRYKEGESVLEDFNLSVRAGETIALVGETGSGKSTIVNLVCRFYEPTEGRVKIDGVDTRERSQLWLQSNLGYVLQTPHLFSGTIADNIRYGNLNATMEQIQEAAKMVGADGFIERLEKGYDTDVGESGNRLSTGEKQLISFARAILANPRIFVLDEATSSVDTETEQRIQLAIRKLLKGRTSFIVAHRLSTIRSADRILVIDGGKIIEEGAHRELLKRRGVYYNLYTNQFREEQQQRVLAGEA